MGTSALHVVVERTALASKLAESRDPVALRRAAAEELAAARWGDRVVRDLLKSGRTVEAIEEQKRNQRSRARARYLRYLAEQIAAAVRVLP